jgi:Cu/Ag efflux protein CusF
VDARGPREMAAGDRRYGGLVRAAIAREALPVSPPVDAMLKRILCCLAICALAASVAQAQTDGGGGGRHGRRHGGGGGGGGQTAPSSSAPAKPEKPVNQIEIIGVVKAIDPQAGRVTIDYEPVDALNWPRGSMPFVVSKPDLLQGVSVGEKVRFKLDSQQVSELKPY